MSRLPASSVCIIRLTHSDRFNPSSCAIFSILTIAVSSKLNERIRRAFFGFDFLKISSSKPLHYLSYLFNNRKGGPFCFAKSALVNCPSAPPPQATNAPAGVDGLTLLASNAFGEKICSDVRATGSYATFSHSKKSKMPGLRSPCQACRINSVCEVWRFPACGPFLSAVEVG